MGVKGYFDEFAAAVALVHRFTVKSNVYQRTLPVSAKRAFEPFAERQATTCSEALG